MYVSSDYICFMHIYVVYTPYSILGNVNLESLSIDASMNAWTPGMEQEGSPEWSRKAPLNGAGGHPRKQSRVENDDTPLPSPLVIQGKRLRKRAGRRTKAPFCRGAPLDGAEIPI